MANSILFVCLLGASIYGHCSQGRVSLFSRFEMASAIGDRWVDWLMVMFTFGGNYSVGNIR